MAQTFEAQIKGFADLTKRNLNYVMRSSIGDVLEAAQTPQQGIGAGATSFEEGKIPVGKTSDLLNSLTVDGAKGADAYVTAIAGMEPGDVKEFAWTMPYARRIEYGFTGEDSLGRHYEVPGRFFVLRNAERFSAFVEARVAEVRK